MTKIRKTTYYIVCVFFVIGISDLLFAGDQNTFIDFISKKITKETKDEYDKNVQMALRFSGALGNKFNSIVKFDHIEKIYIPYQTNINPAQIVYLFQNSIFKKYNELEPWHLAPVGTFRIILKDYSVLEFHIYAGAPIVRVTSGVDEYWLEIPNHKIFYTLGKEKETTK